MFQPLQHSLHSLERKAVVDTPEMTSLVKLKPGAKSLNIIYMEDGEMKVRQENVEPMRDDLGDAIKEVKSMIAERAAEQAGGGN